METVQSDIASEKPGIFDVFQEGLYRLLSWSPPQTGWMISILYRDSTLDIFIFRFRSFASYLDHFVPSCVVRYLPLHKLSSCHRPSTMGDRLFQKADAT